MTLASFFCRLINGRCRKETREPDREPYQKTQPMPAAAQPPSETRKPTRAKD
jgi:hypothetical protein